MNHEHGPIPLNARQEDAVKSWAADDRLWTTQETVEFNLRTFARLILSTADSNDILQAVLDAIKGTLDPSTQIADHPNVKFAQMQRLQWDELKAWKDSALIQLRKSDALHEEMEGHAEYLGWDVYKAIVDLLRKTQDERDELLTRLNRMRKDLGFAGRIVLKSEQP